jgi:hypothetical protein
VWTSLTQRVRAVLRLDWSVFREVAADPHAFGQALVVVVGASALAGLGQGGPSPLALLGIALSIVRWVIASALIALAALVASDAEVDYPRLLRCTGFADAWIALNLLAVLPWVGWLFSLAAIGLWVVALVEATREALHVELQRAGLICAIAAALSLLPACLLVHPAPLPPP